MRCHFVVKRKEKRNNNIYHKVVRVVRTGGGGTDCNLLAIVVIWLGINGQMVKML